MRRCPRRRPGRRVPAWTLSLGSAFDGLDVEQPLLDLTERDGQRLLLAARLHQRPDVLKQALAELRVIGVYLPCALRGHDHEPVLAGHDVQKLVDRPRYAAPG